MEKFLKTKRRGDTHAWRTQRWRQLAASWALSAAQVRSDFSNLQKEWDPGREELKDKADDLRQQVFATAHLAANEMAEVSAAANVTAAYGLLVVTEALDDQASEDLAGPSGMSGVLGDSLGDEDEEDEEVE